MTEGQVARVAEALADGLEVARRSPGRRSRAPRASLGARRMLELLEAVAPRTAPARRAFCSPVSSDTPRSPRGRGGALGAPRAARAPTPRRRHAGVDRERVDVERARRRARRDDGRPRAGGAARAASCHGGTRGSGQRHEAAGELVAVLRREARPSRPRALRRPRRRGSRRSSRRGRASDRRRSAGRARAARSPRTRRSTAAPTRTADRRPGRPGGGPDREGPSTA